MPSSDEQVRPRPEPDQERREPIEAPRSANGEPEVTRAGQADAAPGAVEAPYTPAFLREMNYTFIKRIGRGTFGQVWQASADGGVEVAIKVLVRFPDDSSARRDLADRELQALGLIINHRHAYLVMPHAIHRHADEIAIVMDLADGTLDTRLRQCRQEGMMGIPQAELLSYFDEAAQAIDFLHSKGVQHRDIKPLNILLFSGHAKVADFGLARLKEIDQSVIKATAGAGTPHYTAPEVHNGDLSDHSDQYSLACTYVEMRLDRRVFLATHEWAVILRHLQDMPNLEELPGPEQEVLLKALAKAPRDRYPSCRAFVDALKQAAEPPPPPPPPPPPAPTLVASRQPSLEAVVIGLGGFSTLLAAVLVLLVVVNPFKKVDWLPVRFKPVESTDIVTSDWEKRHYYKEIQQDVAGIRVVFVVVPREQFEESDTFYIMKDKVSVELYRVLTERLNADSDDLKLVPPLAEQQDGYPVMGVKARAACACAEVLGGKVPSVKQWDCAAGRYRRNRGPGPYVPGTDPARPPKIAIGGQLQPIGWADDDRSVLGVCGLAGNGCEWTRTPSLEENRFEEWPMTCLPANTLIWLRGRPFDAQTPFQFEELVDLQRHPLAAPLDQTREDTGFRIVVEQNWGRGNK
jgi:serine/threonine protein kinase